MYRIKARPDRRKHIVFGAGEERRSYVVAALQGVGERFCSEEMPEANLRATINPKKTVHIREGY